MRPLCGRAESEGDAVGVRVEYRGEGWRRRRPWWSRGSRGGAAVGGGATILLHFDAVFIAPNAKIKYPFSDLGLAPEVGSSFLLFQSLGYQQAAQLLFESQPIDGNRYHELGLAKYVGEDCLAEANKYAHMLKEQSLSSIIETKAILKSFMGDDIAKSRSMETAAMKKLFGSEDNIKAVEKFFAKNR